MRRLIVNADDFGFTRGINDAIAKGHRDGILTSATLMANGGAFEDAVEKARQNPRLGVGCHLVLIGGRCTAPAEEVPSLVRPGGELPRSLPELVLGLLAGRIRSRDLETEMRAQVEKIRAAGVSLTHFDTHKHTHCLPSVMRALSRVAKDFRINCVRRPFEDRRLAALVPNGGPRFSRQRAAALVSRAGAPSFERVLRGAGLRAPDHFCGIRMTGHMGPRSLLRMIELLPEGTTELMCHPGYVDAELESARTRLKQQRQQELTGLLDPSVRSAVNAGGIQLISYRELA